LPFLSFTIFVPSVLKPSRLRPAAGYAGALRSGVLTRGRYLQISGDVPASLREGRDNNFFFDNDSGGQVFSPAFAVVLLFTFADTSPDKAALKLPPAA